MLDSLLIEGFRAFERLEIARLGRVNLFVGRNSVGKSTVLEAVRLWASWPVVKAELTRLLERRQEFLEKKPYGSMGGLDWNGVFHEASEGAPARSFELGPTGGGEPDSLGAARARAPRHQRRRAGVGPRATRRTRGAR